jgi:hypothetical protein
MGRAVPPIGTAEQTSCDRLNWDSLRKAIEANLAYNRGNHTEQQTRQLANELAAMTLPPPGLLDA